jgi:hypothetical protein
MREEQRYPRTVPISDPLSSTTNRFPGTIPLLPLTTRLEDSGHMITSWWYEHSTIEPSPPIRLAPTPAERRESRDYGFGMIAWALCLATNYLNPTAGRLTGTHWMTDTLNTARLQVAY